MSDLITNGSFEDAADLTLAKEVGDLLYKHYPHGIWAVEINDHCPVIRLLNAPVQGMSMFINRKDIWSPEQLRMNVIRAGGEWLERCGLSRNHKVGEQDDVTRVEGVDLKLYIDPIAKEIARRKGDK
jgi:hypothetical protein